VLFSKFGICFEMVQMHNAFLTGVQDVETQASFAKRTYHRTQPISLGVDPGRDLDLRRDYLAGRLLRISLEILGVKTDQATGDRGILQPVPARANAVIAVGDDQIHAVKAVAAHQQHG